MAIQYQKVSKQSDMSFFRKNFKRLTRPRPTKCLILSTGIFLCTFFVFGRFSHVTQQASQDRNAALSMDQAFRKPLHNVFQSIMSPFKPLINRTTISLSSNVSILFLIVSSADDVEIRSDIRATWAHPNESNLFQSGEAAAIFVLGEKDGFIESTFEEHKQYHDILLIGLEESYINLVYKLLAAYRWIATTYPQLTVVKIDSDVIPETQQISEIINENLSISAPRISCHINRAVQPIRDVTSRWYISEKSYPSPILPYYCSGPMYILYPYTIEKLIEKANSFKYFEVEDAYFTGTLAVTANIPRYHVKNFLIKNIEEWNCTAFNPAGFLLHESNSRNVREYYNKLKHVNCNSTWSSIRNMVGSIFG